jgi:glycosyltransferase involved in cell wall biosynthesis
MRRWAPAIAPDVHVTSPVVDVEVSVVLACLNEEQSVGVCVEQALTAMQGAGIRGEVIVSDNGSTDCSVERAERAGARIVHEPVRGYGHAYLRGFEATTGRFIVMGDSDASYDFREIPNLVEQLLNGCEYVVGSRFKGEILPGAMPWSHRYIGNPLLTGMLNRAFGTTFTDAHSGLRAMTRDAYRRLDLSSGGMELASELSIRTAQLGLRTAEIPITYHPRAGASKLRPIRDGLRHLRFMFDFHRRTVAARGLRSGAPAEEIGAEAYVAD